MKYVAFYDTEEYASENRYKNIAAVQVVEYMIDVFSSIEPVDVISPARSLNKKGYYRGRCTSLGEHARLIIPPSFGVHNRLFRKLAQLQIQLWLLFYLLVHTKKGETVIFYHSLSLMQTIQVLVKLKKIKPILEFREIYSDINPVSERLKKTEWKYYQCAYGFIFPSETLRKRLDIGDKPYVLAPGSYKIHCSQKESFGDEKIHLVYAGTLRRDKGGAYLAVECARYLDENYTIHILGQGSEAEVASVNAFIREEAAHTKGAAVIFEGYKSGMELYQFLGRCSIGLAVQKTAAFSSTSFPSKILTYLGCGIPVIAPYIDAVIESPVKELVGYYNEDDLSTIESALCALTSRSKSVDDDMRRLDRHLRNGIMNLLKQI